MNAIEFVARTNAGAVQYGEVGGAGDASRVAAGPGGDVSLNLRQADIAGYQRQGADLAITLADGRVIVIADYFSGDLPVIRLHVSADGYLNEVILTEGADGALRPGYILTAEWGKWSPDEVLMFGDGERAVMAPTDVAGAAAAEDEVSMLAALPLLGGFGAGGAAAAAAAVVGGALLTGGGGAGGSTAPSRIAPGVNETDPIIRDGDDPKTITISGQAQPGSGVTVVIGDQTVTTIAGPGGTWSTEFTGATFPADGDHAVRVTVVEPPGPVTDLTGPAVIIDTTPPMLDFTDGTQSTTHVVNAADHADGVDIAGTGEPGATIAVTVPDATRTTTVAADGTWTVHFAPSDIPPGDYSAPVSVVTTDGFGNAASYSDTLVVDTIPHPITINTARVGGDGTVNATEAAGGISVTGTSTPGAVLTVDIGGAAQTVTVAEDGTWQATWAAGVIAGGERDAVVTATTVDGVGNPSSATGTFRMDTVVNRLTASTDAGGADGVINAAEQAGGVLIRGQVEPGSTILVALGTARVAGNVAPDGSWTASFAAAQVPMGDQIVPATVTATDAAGNTRNSTVKLDLDTVFNSLTLAADQVEGDGIINFREAQDGVTLSGTSDPGATVTVSFGSGTRQVITDTMGIWQADFMRADLPADTTTAPITATTTDAAGNVTAVTGTVIVDTVVDNLAITTDPVQGPGLVNATALASGYVVTGTTEPGSTQVLVALDGKTTTASVTPDGQWTALFAPSQVPTGEGTAMLSVTATDRAGNTATVADTVRVDTLVSRLENSATPVEGDNIVNAAEARDGLRLTGRVEPGSTVTVTFDGRVLAATVTGDGTWTADIPATAIRPGTYDTAVQIAATDAAGNTAAISRVLTIDTDVPDGAEILNYTRSHSGISRIGVATGGDDLTVAELQADGTIIDNRASAIEVPVLGETLFDFAPVVPDGSHLIVQATDAAGNASGTYLVFDELTTSVVNLPEGLQTGLGAHHIDAIDLQFAEDSQLTITEAQLLALSPNSDSLTIHGGSDDSVTAQGAVAAGSVQVAGQGYVIYTLGADGRLIVDEDIQVLI